MHFIDNNLADYAKILGITDTKPGTYDAIEDFHAAIANAWFVIEAVPEKLDLKVSIFGELAEKAPADCIFGSNSSSYKSRLMVDQMASKDRQRVLNVHYTMPPSIRTVELMTSTFTNEAIFPFLVEHHRRIKLLPAVARRESTGLAHPSIPSVFRSCS